MFEPKCVKPPEEHCCHRVNGKCTHDIIYYYCRDQEDMHKAADACMRWIDKHLPPREGTNARHNDV